MKHFECHSRNAEKDGIDKDAGLALFAVPYLTRPSVIENHFACLGVRVKLENLRH